MENAKTILKKKKKNKQREIFEHYNLGPEVDEMYPFQLSGGMARRVLVSTALLSNPKLVVADEPTPGLDEKTVKETLNHFKHMKEDGVGVLLITHDIHAALEIADRIGIFYSGYVIEIAKREDFTGNGENLLHPYTKSLYKALPANGFELTKGHQPLHGEISQGCTYYNRCNMAFDRCKQERPQLISLGDKKKLDVLNMKKVHNMELKGSNISFKYPSAKKYILKDIDIHTNKKITGLIGDSGSGKSTLCKILSRYITNYKGTVTLDNEKLPKDGFSPVQLIYQHPEKVMNPKWKMNDILSESWEVDDNLLSEFGIQKSWLTRFPQELSGGELQRFSVLRSLNPQTKFLIADEMTTMLDAITQVQILDSVLKIVKERKMGFLLVSHDMDLVDTICDDKIYFKDINGI